MGKKIGTCQCCKEEKALIKAHVISKALFKSLFAYGKVHKVPSKDLDSRNLIQDGLYDTSILCADCDGIFSPYEEYFSQIVKADYYHSDIKMDSINSNYTLTHLSGFDHYKLRMFFLITLWRCSVSKRNDFKDVNLGNKQDELLRQIRSGLLDTYENYSTILISLENVDDIRKETATTPVIGKWLDCSIMILMFVGWIIIYNFEFDEMPELFEYRLKESQEFQIIKFDQQNGVALLDSITKLNGDFRRKFVR